MIYFNIYFIYLLNIMVIKSKLLFEGSSGCIFKPQIPCNKSKKKKTHKKVSKLLILKTKEYKIGLIIKKISDYKKWTILWNETCISSSYSKLKNNTEIDKCLKSHNINIRNIPQDYNFKLYQGDYGGLTLNNYSKKFITYDTFIDKKIFIKKFKKIFKSLNNVFYGLTKLNEKGICHHDLNIRNILINKNKSYIIDYDMALINIKSLLDDDITKNQFLKERMKTEFEGIRIYDIYPFEYIYYNLKDRKTIIEEQKNIALYQPRIDYYELYEPIHHKLFNTDTDNLRFELLEDKLNNTNKPDLHELISKLDVYSLGMSILILFIDRSEENNIDINNLILLFKLKEIENMIYLIKDMVAFDYRKRIDIHEAYERYKNLI